MFNLLYYTALEQFYSLLMYNNLIFLLSQFRSTKKVIILLASQNLVQQDRRIDSYRVERMFLVCATLRF